MRGQSFYPQTFHPRKRHFENPAYTFHEEFYQKLIDENSQRLNVEDLPITGADNDSEFDLEYLVSERNRLYELRNAERPSRVLCGTAAGRYSDSTLDCLTLDDFKALLPTRQCKKCVTIVREGAFE